MEAYDPSRDCMAQDLMHVLLKRSLEIATNAYPNRLFEMAQVDDTWLGGMDISMEEFKNER